jgi:hypothetical protein
VSPPPVQSTGEFRVPDAAQILFRGAAPRYKIAKTTPCKVGMLPGSQHSRRLRPGHEMVRRHGPTWSHPLLIIEIG